MALGVAALFELLLVLTAAQKLVTPAPAAGALRSAGLAVPLNVVRLGAAVELVAGGGALVSGRPIFTALVALCYGGFAAFIVVARRRPDRVSNCGCFGTLGRGTSSGDMPPTVSHLVFDLAAAGVCGLATVWPSAGVLSEIKNDPGTGVTTLGLALLGCWLSSILLTQAPQTAAAATTAAASRSSIAQ